MAAARTILWTLIFYPGTVLIVLATGVGALIGRGAMVACIGAWGRFHRWCAEVLLGQRVVVEGSTRTTGFYIMKHEAMFETIEIPWMFDGAAVFTKAELFRIPLWGPLARRYGLIPVERDAGASALRAMRKAAKAALAEGRSLMLLPEGTRVPHGDSPPLKSGFAGLYRMIGEPVVPVAVNSGRLRDGWKRLPGTITYRVGEPIPAGLPREEAEARAHAAINALNRAS